MRNSILYTDDFFFLNFFQMLYWKNFYFYTFYFKHLLKIYRFRSVFFNFFNHFWAFKILNSFILMSCSGFYDLNLTLKFYGVESDLLIDSFDDIFLISNCFCYSVVLIRNNYYYYFLKKCVKHTKFDLKKLSIFLEINRDIHQRYINIVHRTAFDFFLFNNSLKKNKLRYYKRLTRVLKRNIHR